MEPHGRVSKQISFFSYRPNKMEHMDSPKQDSETLSGRTIAVDTDTFASSPPADPLVYIFSDAIKQMMESFAAAHQRGTAHMAEKNAAALGAAVEKISETLTSLPPSSAHTKLVAEKHIVYPPAQAHTSTVASDRIDFCRADATGINLPRGGGGGGAHTALSVATIVAPGNSGCYPSHTEGSEKSRGLPDNDSVSRLASDTEFDYPQPKDPSTVASTLQEINKLYCSEERVGAPLCDFMADTINVMARQHMEVSPLEALMARQIRPAHVDVHLKQVNKEIYSHQGGHDAIDAGS